MARNEKVMFASTMAQTMRDLSILELYDKEQADRFRGEMKEVSERIARALEESKRQK